MRRAGKILRKLGCAGLSSARGVGGPRSRLGTSTSRPSSGMGGLRTRVAPSRSSPTHRGRPGASRRVGSDEQKERWLRPLAEWTSARQPMRWSTPSRPDAWALSMNKGEADSDGVVPNGKRQLVAGRGGRRIPSSVSPTPPTAAAQSSPPTPTVERHAGDLDIPTRAYPRELRGRRVPADRPAVMAPSSSGCTCWRGGRWRGVFDGFAQGAPSNGRRLREIPRTFFGRPICAYSRSSHPLAPDSVGDPRTRVRRLRRPWAADADPTAGRWRPRWLRRLRPMPSVCASPYASDRCNRVLASTWEPDRTSSSSSERPRPNASIVRRRSLATRSGRQASPDSGLKRAGAYLGAAIWPFVGVRRSRGGDAARRGGRGSSALLGAELFQRRRYPGRLPAAR